MAVAPTKEVVRFGLFKLDLNTGQLSRNGTELRLPQQPLQLLALLLERAGEIVPREDLRQRLWPSDVFVDFDHGLNKSIQKLRDALGDSAVSPRYIETIPRVGYRFIAPISNGKPQQPEMNGLTRQEPPLPVPPPAAPALDKPKARGWLVAVSVVALLVALGIAAYVAVHRPPAALSYTPLTDFTDSATTPALSPDGRFLAFIRSDSSFMSADQIYVKILPSGEARRLTHDAQVKYSLAFSPDSSRIAYTVLGTNAFSTYTVPLLGGEPRLMLPNAAGLTWIDAQQVLFSRFRTGTHLGVVRATATGDGVRELYYPPHERAMAHYSYASPDRKWALVVVMDGEGFWTGCQLIALDSAAHARPVGPEGGCTSAGWSPDGVWMYFSALVHQHSHLWRQRFPDGRPEQLTFGPTEEDGLAVDRQSGSLITSVGIDQNILWIHDPAGDRPLSFEGDVSSPVFGPDGKAVYYLLHHQPMDSGSELWRIEVDSGKTEPVAPGISIIAFDLSPDGNDVVYATKARADSSQLWLAPVDRSSPPRLVVPAGGSWPRFGAQGRILFLSGEGNVNHLEQINSDGSGLARVVPYPVIEFQAISPARKWATAIVVDPGSKNPISVAIPLEGGPARRLCSGYCAPMWSLTGKFLFLPVEAASRTNPGRSLVIPVGPGERLPPLPPGGIPAGAEPESIPRAQSVSGASFVPGKDLSHYAYLKTTDHRNLYRISLQ